MRIDLARLGSVAPGPPPALDPECHYLEGDADGVALYVLALDTINFGSGWFPTLGKRAGCSGYFTVAWALTERFRDRGPLTPPELREIDTDEVATILGQDPGHELMALYATALRDLGSFFGERTALGLVGEAAGSAERLAGALAAGMPFFDDRGFCKRAQIAPNDLALAGVAAFDDLDRLTIFADNLVPHVLRCDGVLRYSDELAATIDSGRLLAPGRPEQEIRACALHACEQIAGELGVTPATLDGWLWNRGQAPRYKTRPRHRTRTVFY